ncbi:ABC transporter ATPase [Solitalea koreensis]|uniref:ABC transporter ATPase n=1 Tax=Solitalea koreensis TaxID=543615 RepID=A0A521CXA4_9SPHI|nr:ABC transporter ATPase [Solitalea koreensis]SMO64077.1 hypothetical protein SAMN06265350_1058 [Solitalea koreensis]
MDNFDNNSRVWIYQSNRELTSDEMNWLNIQLLAFTSDWTAHSNSLKAKFEVRYNRFIILIVDERAHNASGCSIDKSVNFMKQMEQSLKINLFDRFHIAFKEGETVKSVERDDFEQLIIEGTITADTIVFNNLVSTKAELEKNWETPFKNSWHQQVFGNLVVNN